LQELFDQGVNVVPILSPGVHASSTRLRFFISAVHTKAQMQKTVDLMANYLENKKKQTNNF
tara:strand:- start:467 stop:649 length:183 start_codon:yes stop_codon:yes gene_type:complete